MIYSTIINITLNDMTGIIIFIVNFIFLFILIKNYKKLHKRYEDTDKKIKSLLSKMKEKHFKKDDLL